MSKPRLRTVRTRLRKKDFSELIEDLAHMHWEKCPKGYMICECERAKILREFTKLAERGRPWFKRR